MKAPWVYVVHFFKMIIKTRLKIKMQSADELRRKIKSMIVFFMMAVVGSGITAFPIKTELEHARGFIRMYHWDNAFSDWIEKVYIGVGETDGKFPFIAYGTDWLAFSHLVIALAFIGPLRDPVRNIWVIQFGLMACIAVFPMALIAGEVRGIPLFWRMVDCSFGLIGGITLWSVYKRIKQLESSHEFKP